ncbi:hypothetical protein ACN9ML_06120 [Dyadobacter endophyticus]|uniref:Uncharacterized protein n=1 Tax=Dyadobacter endophyticus TaxID=1749036 RepID=A0ABQ1YIJ1_9BACT|nr:hypothetical protein [Dyadobacter endophyticus]GGH27197.1 hypothetical protein GCM10007423_12750 [Dyadobacter endophyticus]
MLFKSTTIVTSAVSALLHNPKGQLQTIFIAAVVAALILWKLGAGQTGKPNAVAKLAETPATDTKMAGMKWSYDELAHKLIVENTDLAYAEIGEGFTKGIGQALNKVTKQNGGKRVVVNL